MRDIMPDRPRETGSSSERGEGVSRREAIKRTGCVAAAVTWGSVLATGGIIGISGQEAARRLGILGPTSADVKPKIVINPSANEENKETELSLPEVIQAIKRVDQLGSLLRTYLTHPDIGLNTQSPWELSEEEILKLLAGANPKGAETNWEISDDDQDIYRLNVINEYAEGNRLFSSRIRLGINPRRTKVLNDLTESDGTIKEDSLVEAAKRLFRLPDFISFGPHTLQNRSGRIFVGISGAGVDAQTGARITLFFYKEGSGEILVMWPSNSKVLL